MYSSDSVFSLKLVPLSILVGDNPFKGLWFCFPLCYNYSESPLSSPVSLPCYTSTAHLLA